jgi:hypothetical protein
LQAVPFHISSCIVPAAPADLSESGAKVLRRVPIVAKMPSKKMRAKRRNKVVSGVHDEEKKGNGCEDGCFQGCMYYVRLSAAPKWSQRQFTPLGAHVRVCYEEHAFQSLVLPKLSAQIQRHGFRIEPKILLEFVIGYAKMSGSGFVTIPGAAFNYRPCGFGPLDMKAEIFENLLRVERDMVHAALEVVFCGKVTCARNSDPIELIALEPNFYFDSGTGSRRYELTYLAADSEPADVYRVTIQGTEWGSPNQFKFEPSDQWLKNRFPRDVR